MDTGYGKSIPYIVMYKVYLCGREYDPSATGQLKIYVTSLLVYMDRRES